MNDCCTFKAGSFSSEQFVCDYEVLGGCEILWNYTRVITNKLYLIGWKKELKLISSYLSVYNFSSWN